MFKTNRLLSIIVLFLFAVSMAVIIFPSQANALSNAISINFTPVPTGQQSFSYSPAALPILPINSLDFTQATPIGVGSVATGGNTISIQVGLNQFAGPVDIYLAIYAPAIDPNIWIIKPDLSLQPVSDGLVPWKAGTTGPVDESLYGDILASGLPQGIYYLYFAVTPAGSIERFFLWETYFTINSPPPPQTSTTGDEGEATFLTSQGQTLTFEVTDKDTQQALPNIIVKFQETQSNGYIIELQDPFAEYVSTIGTGLDINNQQTSALKPTAIRASNLLNIPVTLIKTAVLEGAEIYSDLQGINYIYRLDENYNAFGINKSPICVTVGDYIDYVEGKVDLLDQKKKLMVNLGLSFIPGPGWVAVAKYVLLDFLLNPIDSREMALFEDLMVSGIIDGSSFEEVIALEFIEPVPGSYANSTMAINEIIVPKKPEPGQCEDNNPPPTPTNLRAVPVSSNQIDLTWDDAPNETNYVIWYSLDGKSFNLIPSGSRIPSGGGPNRTLFSHIFLSSSTTYYYKIRASNVAGLSGYSNDAQATTLGLQNQSPVISSVTANPSSVNTGDTSTVTCNASDPDGDALTYIWTKTGGSISGSGSVVSWTAPSIAGTYKVTCNVSDGKDGTASREVNIAVNSVSIPTVASATPNSGTQGQSLNVAIEGINFTGATSVSFGAGITVNSFTVNSSTQITANISISSAASTGPRNVSVITPTGTGTGSGLFTVTTVSSQSDLIIQSLTVTPSNGTAGSSATVSFTIYNQGSGTANASTTNIRINTSASNVTTSDPLLASISTPSIAAGGSYNVSRSVTIPSSRPSGTNYIWVILDVYSTANQSNELNDKGYTVFTVL